MTKIDKLYINWTDVDHMVDDLINQMFADNWKPDYIVGITRGGLTPAIMMSHKTGIKMFTLDVRLRDGGPGIPTLESNTWMAQDAMAGKKILLVDDINDTGETIKWIKNDWQKSLIGTGDWHHERMWNNVKFAMLIENEASEVSSDYNCKTVNKFEKDVWIVYPWERQYD